jgi:hypothetical protein
LRDFLRRRVLREKKVEERFVGLLVEVLRPLAQLYVYVRKKVRRSLLFGVY